MKNNNSIPSTQTGDYTARLQRREHASWKQLFDVQRPYRWNLNRLQLGYTLDLGCGIGRNLKNLNGNGIGIDHNPESVRKARERGFKAFTPDEFHEFINNAQSTEIFNSMLVAHVCEHMPKESAIDLIKKYLPYIKKNGKVVIITPQPAGYHSDETHVEYIGPAALDEIGQQCSLKKQKYYSFPLPQFFGRLFIHNEHVWIGAKQ